MSSEAKSFFLEDVALFFTKVDPENPVEIDQSGNTGWETQIRTKDRAKVKEWREMNLPVRAVREDKDDEESAILYYLHCRHRRFQQAVRCEPF